MRPARSLPYKRWCADGGEETAALIQIVRAGPTLVNLGIYLN